MWTTTVLLLLCLSTAALSSITFDATFRKIGSVASGLSYGHLHGTIDFKHLQRTFGTLLRTVDERISGNLPSGTERELFEALRPQLDAAMRTLDDLDVQFFGDHHRRKRQLFLGIAMALGLVSVGTSIYTASEIHQLHGELMDLRTTVKHVAHLVDDEAHAINEIVSNMKTTATACKLLLTRVEADENHLTMVTNVLKLQTMIGNVNADLAGWGRGLEALLNGRLHPALVERKKIRNLTEAIEKEAKRAGRQTLHNGADMLFKAPVSFMATANGQINFFAHIALITDQPMSVYEYIPVPVRVNDLYMQVSTEKILALDQRGQTGQEITRNDLQKCHTEDRHEGMLFICPEASIFNNEIKKTCLGSLFYGSKLLEDKCQHTITNVADDQMWQVAKTEIVIISAKNQTLTERCMKNVSYHQIPAGIHQRKVKPGCELSTEKFTFRAATAIDIEDDFIRRPIETEKFDFIEKTDQKEIREALQQLSTLKKVPAIDTDELQAWIQDIDGKSKSTYTSWALSTMGVVAGTSATIAIVYLYVKYIKSKNSRN